jgi:hypothetical protein
MSCPSDAPSRYATTVGRSIGKNLPPRPRRSSPSRRPAGPWGGPCPAWAPTARSRRGWKSRRAPTWGENSAAAGDPGALTLFGKDQEHALPAKHVANSATWNQIEGSRPQGPPVAPLPGKPDNHWPLTRRLERRSAAAMRRGHAVPAGMSRAGWTPWPAAPSRAACAGSGRPARTPRPPAETVQPGGILEEVPMPNIAASPLTDPCGLFPRPLHGLTRARAANRKAPPGMSLLRLQALPGSLNP